ncbi:CRISPR system precrRNA processing endoribonuclease RAMP protein Cas6 [Fodinisporobacter ferrooxydans]|uniref:CRISPR system precrRNA processing endoribonuclease RAMP protein Cas6 n=1 Tax=Fodinisporobacter ferrooxydans TaxID=2901836 RepID=A0ABY4CTE4_9BACL|nr:CRISPR system precrRNA processing endoribonuclease RAMP protein Cas6 [Alicyclobacillaceae bacterium MYW30-H2]
MLCLWSITLACITEGKVRGNEGEAVHGWLFNNLRNLSPEIASRWHEVQVKPFRVSFKNFSAGKNYVQGDTATLMIGAATFEAVHFIGELIQKIDCVKLGTAIFLMKETSILQQITYDDLIQSSFTSVSTKERKVQFLSPTTFRSEGVHILFPTPELFFSGLGRKFNALYQKPFPPFSINWDREILINRYRLQTTNVSFVKYKIVSFTGDMIFSPTGNNISDYTVSIFKLLCDFANYMGIGYKSTMGLGHVKIV